MQTDPTARRDDGRYRGLRALVIGSGSDLDGRGMGQRIDGGEWDLVCRVNKWYGASADVGTRCDLLVTRWASWLDRTDWVPHLDKVRDVVILNQHIGVSRTEAQWLAAQVGHPQVSAGIQAVHYLLARGARVDVIGFGARAGVYDRDKIYTAANAAHVPATKTDGLRDVNETYNWAAEKLWLANQPRVTML